MIKRLYIISLLIVTALSVSAQIEKIKLIEHSEMEIHPECVLQVPGVGLCYAADNDSIIMFNDLALEKLGFLQRGVPRSLVALTDGIYAAQGDSIVRMATDSVPSKFICRLDNEQFHISPASGNSIFALTADEEFSCVYEVFPEDDTIEPVFSVDGPVNKIFRRGEHTLIWADDMILRLNDDQSVTPVYESDKITDVAMSSIGLMIAQLDGIYLMPSLDSVSLLTKEPVQALWWEDGDILYYLSASGDVIAISGIEEAYLLSEQN